MKFGLCCSLENAPLALDAGYDYVELAASQLMGGDPDFSGRPFAGLPVEATNVFFAGSVKLFGPERTPAIAYVERTIARAADAGVRLMVIGSGASRNAPDGVDAAGATEGFLRIAEAAQLFADRFGVTMAPESLNRTETNVGYDLPSFARALRSVGVAYTLDTYHVLYEEGESPIDWAAQIPFLPAHVHVGNRPRQPFGVDEPELHAAASRLRELGYDGRVSYEGAIQPDQFGSQLAAIKAIFG